MSYKRRIPTGPAWVSQIFQAKQALRGGTVRRSIHSVNQYANSTLLENEVKRRGFHMIVNGSHYVILCNSGALHIVC